MKLGKKISSKQFVLFIILILIISSVFLGYLHYMLNIQYRKPNDLFINGPVTSPLKSLRLDLDQPDNDTLTFQSSVIVSGQTMPSTNILISTDTVDTVIKSKPDGSFSTVLDLNEGENRITVIVFDPTGDSRSQSRTVFYSKEQL